MAVRTHPRGASQAAQASAGLILSHRTVSRPTHRPPPRATLLSSLTLPHLGQDRPSFSSPSPSVLEPDQVTHLFVSTAGPKKSDSSLLECAKDFCVLITQQQSQSSPGFR